MKNKKLLLLANILMYVITIIIIFAVAALGKMFWDWLIKEELQRQINVYDSYYGIKTDLKWRELKTNLIIIKNIKNDLRIIYPLTNYRKTSYYGLRKDPMKKNTGGDNTHFHEGLDLGANTGEPIFSVADGYVEKVRWYKTTGLTIIIHHAWIKSYYGHLKKSVINENTYVKKGVMIGLVGNTGRSTGSHLHFAIKNHDTGQFQNPILYLE